MPKHAHKMSPANQADLDEFRAAMERAPDYGAFLGRFDGFKNYHLIPPAVWAEWDKAVLAFQSEDGGYRRSSSTSRT